MLTSYNEWKKLKEGLIGGTLGAVGGAALGSLAGPVGMAAGATLGSRFGSQIGDLTASELGYNISATILADCRTLDDALFELLDHLETAKNKGFPITAMHLSQIRQLRKQADALSSSLSKALHPSALGHIGAARMADITHGEYMAALP